MIDADALIEEIARIPDLRTLSTKTIGKAINKMATIEPEPQWIPCSEQLPEEEYVLISKKPTKISGNKWCVTIAIRMADPRSRKVNWRDIGFGVIPDDNVLAWMPLPELWKGADNEIN